MNKIGLVFPHLGSSQAAFYSINRVNKLLENGSKDDFTFFYENLVTPCFRPLCSTFCVNELIHFEGVLITSTIDTTIRAYNVSPNSTIAFYMWDVEFLRAGKQNFLYNLQAFNNSNIILIARGQDHVWMVENYANRKVDYVVPMFDLTTILEKINEHSRNHRYVC